MGNSFKAIERLVLGSPTGLSILLASVTGPASSPFFYERAIRRNHHLLTFGPFRDSAHWRWAAESLKEHVFYRDGSSEHWLDICTRMAEPCDIVTDEGVVDLRQVISKLPDSFRPDLFVWIDQHLWNLPVNMHCLDCPTVAIFGDTHLRGNWSTWIDYAKMFDFVFVSFNRHHIPLFVDAGCRHVFWSPAAFDPEFHCQIPGEKVFATSFIGGTHPVIHKERIALLKKLQTHGFSINIDSRVHRDMSRILSHSKIALNRSSADDLNMRVFETLATGTLLFTNRLPRQSGLEDLFIDRKHLVLYDDDNIIDLLSYYLKNEEEREWIAACGRNLALSRHTYEHRMDQIIKIVRDTLIYEIRGEMPDRQLNG